MSDQSVQSDPNVSTSGDDSKHGRWTIEEHQLFLEGINKFGREWDKVQSVVKTRSLAQIRSHAQKYFLKVSKNEEMEKLTEYGYWQMPVSTDHANALIVLDFMGNVLKKLKKKRHELALNHLNELATIGSSYHESSSNGSQSANSFDNLDEVGDDQSPDRKKLRVNDDYSNSALNILQRAIEQLDDQQRNSKLGTDKQ
jgi:SHAQKYF class myb-like DNA-binding protein